MAKKTYPSIPTDAVIDIKISGSYYRALAQLLLGLTQQVSQDKYASCIDKFKNNKPAADLTELNLILITSLAFTIEQAANDQKVTTEIEVDVPDEPVANP